MLSNGIGFDVTVFDQLKLAKALQGEVGILQGKRPSKPMFPTWSDLDSEMNDWRIPECTEVDDASTGKDVTKVLKMECNVCKSCEYDTDRRNSDKLKLHMQRVLQAFCFLSRLNDRPATDQPFIPSSQTNARYFFDVNFNDYARTAKGAEKAGQKNYDAHQSKNPDNPDQSKNSKSNRETGSNPGGGGGGGKRPPPNRESTTDIEVSMDDPTETETTDQEVERKKKKHHKKRKSRANEDTSEFATESANVTQTDDGETRRIHRKKSKRLEKRNKVDNLEENANVAELNTVSKRGKSRKTKIITMSEVEQLHSRDSVSSYAGLISTIDDTKRLNERDHEWLDWTSSDELHEHNSRENSSSVDPVDPDLLIFMRSTKLLDNVNSILGLNPYSRVTLKNGCVQVCWNPKSMEFLGVCINSLIFFITTISVLVALHTIFTSKEPLTISKRIIQTDFANHFTEGLLVICFSLFLSIWGISCIMELGFHYAEFMSRFNQGICLTKYDVSEGIHEMIQMHLTCIFGFVGGMIVIFFGGRTSTATVREGCGFLGYTLIRPFNNKIRESIYYPIVEILGLLVFLHVFICFNVVVLYFGVYAKAMENMAKQLNLRLVYTLGMIVERRADGSVKLVKKIIPYDKIYAEHLTVCSIFRHLGHVNDIVFSSLILVMCFQIILSIWLFFEEMSSESENKEEKYLDHVGNIQLAVTLRLRENNVESTVKAFVVFQIVALFCISFISHMHNAGENLQICHQYVRRHGVIMCESSKERRFILSMSKNIFPPIGQYWVGRVLHLNRNLLLGIMGFLFTASCVFNSYHPSRTGGIVMEQCDAYGQCIAYKVPRTTLGILYVSVPGAKAIKKTPNPLFPTTRRHVAEESTTEKPSFHDVVPKGLVSNVCRANGDLPFVQNHHYVQCPTTWNSPGLPKVINIPYAFSRDNQTFGDKHQISFFLPINEPFINAKLFPDCTKGGLYPFPKFEWKKLKNILDCTGSPLNKTLADDCENLAFITPNATGETSQAVIRVITTTNLPGKIEDDLSVLCCWQYTGFSNQDKQYKTCNLPSAKEINNRCKYGFRNRRGHPDTAHFHYGITNRFLYETRRKNVDNYLKQYEDDLKPCLCFANIHHGYDDLEDIFCDCQSKFLPPCTPGFFTNSSFDVFTRCGDASVPRVFKVNLNYTLSFAAVHQRYKQFCTEWELKEVGTHDDNIMATASCSSTGGTSTKLADCSGKVLKAVVKDDCENWGLDTPDRNGKMLPPKLKLQIPRLKLATKQLDRKGDGFAILCCFEYASPFINNSKSICNAPSIEAANSPQFCGWHLQTSEPSGLRAEHKLRLQQRLNVIEHGAHHLGNKLKVTQTRKGRADWEKCICHGNSLPETDNVHKECESHYLPPCVGAKGIESSIAFLPEDKMYITCPLTGWKVQDQRFPTKALHIPIIQKFDPVENKFTNVKRYKNMQTGKVTEECPTGAISDKFNGSSTDIYTDCYGNQWNPSDVDDCGNPGVRSPTKGNPKLSAVPDLQLMAFNLIGPSEGFHEDDFRVFCCYQYPFAHPEEYTLCSMPSKSALIQRCAIHRHKEIDNYITKLENKRAKSDDPLKLSTGRYDRWLWTRCLCYSELGRCKLTEKTIGG